MSAIKSKDTSIEIKLRKALYAKGYRYRKNCKDLPGKPDIAITKYKIAIFCDSEFFHGYNWDERQYEIKTNRDYWVSKITRNMQRDKEVERQLKSMGWIVVRFWGNEITKHLEDCVKTIDQITFELKVGDYE